MPESKDPAIKLFGKKIPLSIDSETQPIRLDDSSPNALQEKQGDRDDEAGRTPDKESTSRDAADTVMEQRDDHPDNSDDENNSEPLIKADPNHRTKEQTAKEEKSSKAKKEQNVVDSQEKPLKKPDNILACPRCNSMETKFCYYNNYNVNQPRYFCKSCQRYWTAGGTMRNVPVGAGRRRNKNSASHYRHVTISEALQAARIDSSDEVHLPLKNNVRVLSFGLDAPICDSMATILNLTDKKVPDGTRNGFHSIGDQSVPVPCKSKETGDECSSTSSFTAVTSAEDVGNRHSLQQSFPGIDGFSAQIPCRPGVPWPYPWSSTALPPAFCPAGFSFPFYPVPFSNCAVPCNWSIPWFSPQPSSPRQMPPSSGPNSPTLGKHSRDGDMLKSDILEHEESLKQKNGRVLVPKTLRIDDPCEAAKSSIWATLGINNEAVSGGGMFKAFQPKKDEKNLVEASRVLRINPAALSRSLDFHERF